MKEIMNKMISKTLKFHIKYDNYDWTSNDLN
jgi:hypothetical protein